MTDWAGVSGICSGGWSCWSGTGRGAVGLVGGWVWVSLAWLRIRRSNWGNYRCNHRGGIHSIVSWTSSWGLGGSGVGRSRGGSVSGAGIHVQSGLGVDPCSNRDCSGCSRVMNYRSDWGSDSGGWGWCTRKTRRLTCTEVGVGWWSFGSDWRLVNWMLVGATNQSMIRGWWWIV